MDTSPKKSQVSVSMVREHDVIGAFMHSLWSTCSTKANNNPANTGIPIRTNTFNLAIYPSLFKQLHLLQNLLT